MKIVLRIWLLWSFSTCLSTAQNKSIEVQARSILPTQYRSFRLDEQAFLAQIPLSYNTIREITLPTPDGGSQRFRIEKTPMLSPDLEATFPDMHIFTGLGIDEPTATVYMDWTANGLHAMIFSEKGIIFIDPYHNTKTEHYLAYFKRDYPPPAPRFCQTHGRAGEKGDKASRSSDNLKRTYRIAVASTGEYTQARGGTIVSAESSIITTINRVRGVYEKELGISFVLVNNTNIIYTNGTTDPFDNNNAGSLINQSQREIDAKIGNANYDIGHTFSTGGGGLASLGVVCRAGMKAEGITGSNTPFDDPYDIDYVAHEIGHQFGADHTFNGTNNACGGGNRVASNAYEVGSGSTVMSYAGICGAIDNLQSNSDPYFHTSSYDQIADYISSNTVNTCPTKITQSNAIPILSMPVGNFFIPQNTPFELTASASDANPTDVLTYCWEQMDLGNAGEPTNAGASGPSFRSFLPTLNPTRYFPRTSGNPNLPASKGETLPTVARSFKFRCTVRDKKTETKTDLKTLDIIGAITYGDVQFAVTDQAGPFKVTAPNTPETVWQGGSTQNIAWAVRGTNRAPVNCTKVDIWLSTDGGVTYTVLLAEKVPNDGNQQIVVPNVSTSNARVKVKAVGNIFFDISDNNFAIEVLPLPTFTLIASPEIQKASEDMTFRVQLGSLHDFDLPVNLTVSGLPTGVQASWEQAQVFPPQITTLTLRNVTGLAGKIRFYAIATSGNTSKSVELVIDASNLPPTAQNAEIIIQEDAPFYAFQESDFRYEGFYPLEKIRITALNLPTGASLTIGRTVVNNDIITWDMLARGLLRFSPALDGWGEQYASFSFEVADEFAYSTTSYKMTMRVSPINDSPVITHNTGIKSFVQDIETFTIGIAAFRATDIEDNLADLSIKILTLPRLGKLLLNGVEIQAYDVFSQSAVLNNQLAYQPHQKGSLQDDFTFQVIDTNEGISEIQTFYIDINESYRIDGNQISLYPNPAQNVLWLDVRFPSTLKIQVQVYDVTGKELHRADAIKEAGESYALSLEHIPQGLYFLRIGAGKEVWIRKFVKVQK